MQQGDMTTNPIPDFFETEFDEVHRILHLAYKRTVHPTTPAHLEMKFNALRKVLDQYISSGRIYLIIDMSNLILEPDLKMKYVELARGIRDTYIMPGGIARYGFQITRITVRQGYNTYLGESPNIFNSRGEAYAYIHSLINRHRKAGITTDSSIPVPESSDRLSER
jgi:hypothetical protein